MDLTLLSMLLVNSQVLYLKNVCFAHKNLDSRLKHECSHLVCTSNASSPRGSLLVYQPPSSQKPYMHLVNPFPLNLRQVKCNQGCHQLSADESVWHPYGIGSATSHPLSGFHTNTIKLGFAWTRWKHCLG